jgi:hypothetical protein
LGPGTGLTPAEVEAALIRLHAAGALYLADGMIKAAYPLSGVPTRHRLTIGRTTAYANCALDALAAPFMVNEPVRIESECAHCGRSVTVQMRGDQVAAAEPAAPMVFCVAAGDCGEAGPAVLTRCPYINFVCGAEHAAGWQTAHAERPGRALQLTEAITLARERFDGVIRLLRGESVPPAALFRSVQWLTSGREE